MNVNKEEKINYNYNLLLYCCEKDNAKIDTEYLKNIKLNRDKNINFVCNCGEECTKIFRNIYEDSGMYCKKCMKRNTIKKRENTNIKKYNVKSVSQLKEIQDKIKATSLSHFGTERPTQSKQIQEKVKQTNLERRGKEYPTQCPEVMEKVIETNLEKRGVKYSLQSEEVKKKGKETNVKNLGVQYGSQSKIIQDKIKNTNLLNYGKEYPNQSIKVQEKTINTNLKKYGVKYVSQVAEISKKAADNNYKNRKEYILPSGKQILIQGYEPFGIDIILKTINEDDIIYSRDKVPELWWYDKDNQKHRHYVDFFIKTENKCIEIKSERTFEINEEKVYLKQKYAKISGYLYEIWIFNKKGQLVNKII
jgi:hypothetical protein